MLTLLGFAEGLEAGAACLSWLAVLSIFWRVVLAYWIDYGLEELVSRLGYYFYSVVSSRFLPLFYVDLSLFWSLEGSLGVLNRFAIAINVCFDSVEEMGI